MNMANQLDMFAVGDKMLGNPQSSNPGYGQVVEEKRLIVVTEFRQNSDVFHKLAEASESFQEILFFVVHINWRIRL